VWPKCVDVQGRNRDHGLLLFLQYKKIEKMEAHFDRAAKDKATHRGGEWNTTAITCKDDGTIMATVGVA
jgi:hypothetical protein